MSDNSDQMLRIFTEMRDLLRLLAEPAIAERDKKRRIALRGIAGAAKGKKAKAVLLMDGTKTRQDIIGSCGIDASDLSGLIKKLGAAQLLTEEAKPRLAISLPSNFFETGEDGDE